MMKLLVLLFVLAPVTSFAAKDVKYKKGDCYYKSDSGWQIHPLNDFVESKQDCLDNYGTVNGVHYTVDWRLNSRATILKHK